MTSRKATLCPSCASTQPVFLGALPDSDWFAGKRLPQSLAGGALYRCRHCCLKFRYPIQSAAGYQRLYDNQESSAWSATHSRPDWSLIVDQIRAHQPRGRRVLDFGCYTGGLLAQLGTDYECYGVEINQCAAAIAVETLGISVWPSASDIPDGLAFDVIVVADVIEHIENPGMLIDGLAALLSPRGIIVITTGDGDNRLWNRFGANWWYCFYPEHIAFISEAWVEYYSGARNLKIEHCEAFRYRILSSPRWIFETLLTYFYGFFPGLFSRCVQIARQVLGRPGSSSVPGNGVSADHLLVVLAKRFDS